MNLYYVYAVGGAGWLFATLYIVRPFHVLLYGIQTNSFGYTLLTTIVEYSNILPWVFKCISNNNDPVNLSCCLLYHTGIEIARS